MSKGRGNCCTHRAGKFTHHGQSRCQKRLFFFFVAGSIVHFFVLAIPFKIFWRSRGAKISGL